MGDLPKNPRLLALVAACCLAGALGYMASYGPATNITFVKTKLDSSSSELVSVDKSLESKEAQVNALVAELSDEVSREQEKDAEEERGAEQEAAQIQNTKIKAKGGGSGSDQPSPDTVKIAMVGDSITAATCCCDQVKDEGYAHWLRWAIAEKAAAVPGHGEMTYEFVMEAGSGMRSMMPDDDACSTAAAHGHDREDLQKQPNPVL